jgi:membrane protein DedA with SNARE-associated domain
MSEKIIAAIAAFIIAVIGKTGYVGIALLMAIESTCVPLPSEIIMPFAGYQVYLGHLNLYAVATAGALGCNLGSVIAYWIGAIGGRPLIVRFGRFVLLSEHDLDSTTHFFQKYGTITVLIGRLLPVVRTFIALPAGVARMPQGRFHLYTFLGSWPWCYALALVGAKLGEHWETDPRFKATFHRFHLAVEIALLIGIVWFVWSHVKGRARATEPAV